MSDAAQSPSIMMAATTQPMEAMLSYVRARVIKACPFRQAPIWVVRMDVLLAF